MKSNCETRLSRFSNNLLFDFLLLWMIKIGLKSLRVSTYPSTLLVPASRMSQKKQRTLLQFFAPKSRPISTVSADATNDKKSDETEPKTVKRELEELQETNETKKVKVDDSIEKHKLKNEYEDVKTLLKIEQSQSSSSALDLNIPPTNPIMYSVIAETFEELENEPGRLKNIATACALFKKILCHSDSSSLQEKTRDLTIATYLVVNRLGPDYEPGLELGLGETILLKALSQGTGREMSSVKADYRVEGDIGVVALKSRSSQRLMFKPKRLTMFEVWKQLNAIAKSEGSNSQSKKIGIINKLLTASEGIEAKFLMRSLEGKLRINFGEKSVIIALSKAIVEYQKPGVSIDEIVKAEEQMKEAFCQVPNYEFLINLSMQSGILNLMDHCGLSPGIPLKPMLAKPTKSISEILDSLEGKRFTCEYKYDGERAQLHLLPNGSLRVYSRNSEDMTQRYPDLVRVVESMKLANPDIKSLILDTECVAWDLVNSKILPFQILSTRKRKDVQESDIKVQVCLFVFDILYYNGESLIHKSLAERREYLAQHLKPIDGKLLYATKMDSNDLNEITKFLDQSVQDSCEGLMIKTLDGKDSYYEPSKRSRNWLKLKKDYLEGVGDSLDLVVIGGYIGKGKRTGGYGGFLLAGYNQDTGEYETICKIGTGFSEELLKRLYELLKPTEISKPRPSYNYDKTNSNAIPDVWFEPTILFEVKVADLTTSPIYKCGSTYVGDGQKGISLRFPRFIQIRTDKGPEDATSSDQIVEMYSNQSSLQ